MGAGPESMLYVALYHIFFRFVNSTALLIWPYFRFLARHSLLARATSAEAHYPAC